VHVLAVAPEEKNILQTVQDDQVLQKLSLGAIPNLQNKARLKFRIKATTKAIF
jgi:hypothetical protein